MLAVTYKVKNTYRSTNLFTQKQLSVAIKNKYFEIENYDKEAESGGADAAKSDLKKEAKVGVTKISKQSFRQDGLDDGTKP